ncbi:hypothetical protein N7457_007431 [Penicillium paradoxum]|uniref:uncharacterized protein n=1 Tax=Penicillium paradoxum TaxID=176176 RepID=UPI002546DA26|nr:uncharacterized protein N7457_007431 [Penicillium paradoxum]KAJ5779711.1 hypothetical protein N7457_007431 [Penicillium paradoxum]
MNENHYSAASDIWHGELLDSPLCHKCLELHDHHACTTSLPKPLSADAMSLPPRSIKSGITGALSLHDYRKFLSKSADCVGDRADHGGRPLKRKPAALHLNRPPPLTSYPISVSSAASSTPPLSPSYSHSIISQQSEEPEIGEAQPVHYRSSPAPRVTVVPDIGPRTRPNRKRLNTFREKVQKNAQAQAEARRSARTEDSNSMLASTRAVATVTHGGACFEILNPRKSLDLARIVSYIEDVDSCSIVSADNQRESTFSLEQGLDRVSLSQFTDASLPSFYSTSPLYTSFAAESSTPKGQPTDLPPSSPGIHGHIRALSDYSLNEQTFNYWSRSVRNTENEISHDTYNEHAFDRQNPHMISIREESNPPALDLSRRPSTPSTQTFYSESEIGEPGSPVYANGEWAQVDERDRGIFFEPEELTDQHEYPYQHEHEHEPEHRPEHRSPQHEELPTPRETPLDTPIDSPVHSPMYTHWGSYHHPHSMSTSRLPYPAPDSYAYDPVYFDPHVQSVLAAANAETMGLRGNTARTLDDLQRGGRELDSRFEFQRRKSDERKHVRGKGLKKFFSWRSGN